MLCSERDARSRRRRLLGAVAGFARRAAAARAGAARDGARGSLPPRGAARRQSRYSQVVRTELARVVREGYSVKPAGKKHLTTALRGKINVVDVDVSPDLTSAAVVVSIVSDDELEKREAFSWLVRNRTPLRYAIARRMAHLKRVPELAFKRADISQAVEMMALIEVRADEGLGRARARRCVRAASSAASTSTPTRTTTSRTSTRAGAAARATPPRSSGRRARARADADAALDGIAAAAPAGARGDGGRAPTRARARSGPRPTRSTSTPRRSGSRSTACSGSDAIGGDDGVDLAAAFGADEPRLAAVAVAPPPRAPVVARDDDGEGEEEGEDEVEDYTEEEIRAMWDESADPASPAFAVRVVGEGATDDRAGRPTSGAAGPLPPPFHRRARPRPDPSFPSPIPPFPRSGRARA